MRFQKFLPLTQSPVVFVARSCGCLSTWHWNLGLGSLVWAWDSSLLRYPSQILSTTCGCGISPFHVCILPTSLDGCGFFNSIVIRLPSNSISDSFECWLFCILVVILMWLCTEASCDCLHCHLDWKSLYKLLCIQEEMLWPSHLDISIYSASIHPYNYHLLHTLLQARSCAKFLT